MLHMICWFVCSLEVGFDVDIGGLGWVETRQ